MSWILVGTYLLITRNQIFSAAVIIQQLEMHAIHTHTHAHRDRQPSLRGSPFDRSGNLFDVRVKAREKH